jgi:hypothetical protein
VTSFALRCLALGTMICDHVGYALLPRSPWLRVVGRLAFPIYCFLLAQGIRHTRSVGKYALRMALFALVSEIPYDLLFHRRAPLAAGLWAALPPLPVAHNVFFSLLLALGAVVAYQHFWPKQKALAALCVAGACVLAIALETDYTFWGILMTLAFYIAGDRPLPLTLGFVGPLGLYQGYRLANRVSPSWVATQCYCLLALPLLLLYNGKPGYRGGKWLFYALYPAHLLVLAYWKNIMAFFT